MSNQVHKPFWNQCCPKVPYTLSVQTAKYRVSLVEMIFRKKEPDLTTPPYGQITGLLLNLIDFGVNHCQGILQ